jgi:outer membrane lipopolysaccharide assembly protein LptE/RlpB
MNNLIKNEIKLYSGQNTTNIYNLKIETNYIKETLTKDSAGLITDYKLSVTSIFTIDLKEKAKVIELKETINIKNQSDSFEQNTYEKNIKRIFASSIREKLMSEILNINDN